MPDNLLCLTNVENGKLFQMKKKQLKLKLFEMTILNLKDFLI